MSATARSLPPTPAPVAPSGRRGATGPTHGAGLSIVEGPGWRERLDQAASHPGPMPVLSQLQGEALIGGIVAEGLAWPILGGGLGWSLANTAALGALIVGQLAHREHSKRSRIAARRTKGTPAWL